MDPFSFLEESGDKKSWIFAIFDYFPVVPDALPRSGVTFSKWFQHLENGFSTLKVVSAL